MCIFSVFRLKISEGGNGKCFTYVLCDCQLVRPLKCLCVCLFVQVKNLSSRLEQEIHKRNLSQSELKMQNQQVSVLRSSEKQLKQELNHLLDMKQILEKQSQELRRSNTHTHTQQYNEHCEHCGHTHRHRAVAVVNVLILLAVYCGESNSSCLI